MSNFSIGEFNYVPDAMARATNDFGDGNICGTLSNGNTVIASSNVTGRYVDKIGRAYMDTVCVGAVTRSSNVDVMDSDVVAEENVHMKSFAIDGIDPTNKRIVHMVEFN